MIDLTMKVYNLCNKSDNDFARSALRLTRYIESHEIFIKNYSSFCVSLIENRLIYHNLNGPAIVSINHDYIKYYINNVNFSESHYWGHQSVIQYQYLKSHPELQAFV